MKKKKKNLRKFQLLQVECTHTYINIYTHKCMHEKAQREMQKRHRMEYHHHQNSPC